MVPLLNKQPSESVSYESDGALEVHSLFYTIQGEGPYAGRPAVFVRLAGCNLQCPFCDTDYTSKRQVWLPHNLADAIYHYGSFKDRKSKWDMPLIVLTGGEPFRQRLGPFISICRSRGYKVQIETNGLLFQEEVRSQCMDKSSVNPVCNPITIVCSPKTAKINGTIMPYIDALKYIISADAIDTQDYLPTSSLGMEYRVVRPWEGFEGEVYVQPCDERDPEKLAANTQAAVKASMIFGYRLCLQIHKIVGLE